MSKEIENLTVRQNTSKPFIQFFQLLLPRIINNLAVNFIEFGHKYSSVLPLSSSLESISTFFYLSLVLWLPSLSGLWTFIFILLGFQVFSPSPSLSFPLSISFHLNVSPISYKCLSMSLISFTFTSTSFLPRCSISKLRHWDRPRGISSITLLSNSSEKKSKNMHFLSIREKMYILTF